MKAFFSARVLPLVAGASLALTTAAAAQQPSVVVNDDNITIRGCVSKANPASSVTAPMLVWTRGDIMLSNANALGSGKLTERVFYWLDDDEDLAKHVGQLIEVKGDLGDFEKGEVDIERDGDFTRIELKIDGDTERVRVPTAWLGTPPARDAEFDIVTRKIDVDETKIIGACPVR